MIVRVASILLLTVATGALLATGALAQDRGPADLKTLPASGQVASVSYCRGAYEVALKDGSVRGFKEYDLAFKTDTGGNGPARGTPALVPTGRVGDRAFVVFAGLDELKNGLRTRC